MIAKLVCEANDDAKQADNTFEIEQLGNMIDQMAAKSAQPKLEVKGADL